MDGYRFALILDGGETADPAVFNTVVPGWRAGDTFLAGINLTRFRIIAIDERVGNPFDGLWLVEPI